MNINIKIVKSTNYNKRFKYIINQYIYNVIQN